jgi:c(7)-type cytochrome triheme protein
MRGITGRRAGWWAAGAGLALATTLAAQTLPKLPDGIALPQSADSPGQVTFNHATHVDDASPSCTACHPRQFSMLDAERARRGLAQGRVAITHERMQKGKQCGACHDGKKAFAIEDDCTGCHQP